jgi:hypothetical protein
LKCNRFIVAHDADQQDVEKIRQKLIEKVIQPSGVKTSICLLIPTEAIEAWLWPIFKRVAIFRDTRNGVPSDFGSEKLATTMPSAARARPAFVCGADTSLRSHRPLLHSDSTPVRLPYVLSPPAMEPQTSTKHPALWLRGGRRRKRQTTN